MELPLIVEDLTADWSSHAYHETIRVLLDRLKNGEDLLHVDDAAINGLASTLTKIAELWSAWNCSGSVPDDEADPLRHANYIHMHLALTLLARLVDENYVSDTPQGKAIAEAISAALIIDDLRLDLPAGGVILDKQRIIEARRTLGLEIE